MRKPNIPQPEQERRARQWIGTRRALFNWAVEKDRLPASPLARMRPPTKERTRDRVLSDSEIRWFWEGCDEIGWPFGPLFKLLLLTAQRRDEVAGMARSEIDLEKRVWSIPRHNSKNDRGHEVQLSDFDMQWPRRNCFGLHCHWRYACLRLFPRETSSRYRDAARAPPITLVARERQELRKRLGIPANKPLPVEIPNWRLHDLRRTATTGMARLNFPPHVVDKVLNHASGTIRGMVAVYNRFEYLEERRAALEAWGRHVSNLVLRQPSNVIALTGR